MVADITTTALQIPPTPITVMQATRVARQYVVRITLFTRENCSLCTDAKKVLSNVWDKRPFEYDEINVMEPVHDRWKIYEFDTPVVWPQRALCRYIPC